MSRENQVTRLMVTVGLVGACLVLVLSLSGTASAQEPTARQYLTLTAPAELQLPEEPGRHYAWPMAVMGAATVGVGSLAGIMAASGLCDPLCGDDGVVAAPYALGGALFTVGLAWLIARVVRFRRAHRAFEEDLPHLVW